MNATERAKYYLGILQDATTLQEGANKIRTSLNSLVDSKTESPISNNRKIEILNKVIELISNDVELSDGRVLRKSIQEQQNVQQTIQSIINELENE